MQNLQAKIPERTLLLAPANWFFTHSFELPEQLPAKELHGFVELSLEGVSPFPLEQLAWGYLSDARSNRVFTYATPWSRISKQKIEKPESFFHAFPGFISCFGDVYERNTMRVVFQNGAISAVFFAAHDPLPVKVVSRPVQSEEWDDAALLQARDKLLQSLQPINGYEIQGGILVGDGYSIGNDDRIRLSHRIIGQGAPVEQQWILPLRGKALWNADIRESGFAAKASRSRKQSQQLWMALQAVGGFALLLLLLQLTSWTLSAVNSFRFSKIAQQNPAVMLVANKQTLANRLIQTAEEELRPFAMLQAINTPRPDSVFFRSAISRAFNILELEGEAGDVNAVNRYADALRALPFIRSVENTPRTQRGQTTFQMVIHFSQIPTAATTATALTPNPAED